MSVKPKFKVKWTQTKSATYNVPAKTYEEAYKFFEAKNKSKTEWAVFSATTPGISFGPQTPPITDVELSIGYTITMPSWPSAKSASSATCGAAWDKMMKALALHEDGHKEILEEQVAEFGKLISSQTDLDKATLAKLLKELTPKIDKAQKAYDAQNDHGIKQGVFLPAPDKC